MIGPMLLPARAVIGLFLVGALAEAQTLPASRKTEMARLVELLGSEDLDVCVGAAAALGRIGEPAVPALVEALGVKAQRTSACEALANIGPDAKGAVAGLVPLLGDRDVLVRMRAAIALGRIGTAAVPALIKAIEDPASRPCACTALGMVQPADPAALQALVSVLENGSDRLGACSAALAIAWMGPDAGPAVPKLLRVLENEKLVELAKTRTGAGASAALVSHSLLALGRIGPQASAAVPALTRLAELRGSGDGVDGLRAGAVEALGRLGPAASAAIPELQRTLAGADGSVRVREAAARALAVVSPDSSAEPHLHRPALEHQDPEVRMRAAMELGRAGPQAGAGAVDDLVRVLETDPSPRVRAEAATSLGFLGKGSAKVRAALEGASQSSERAVRVRAKGALDAITPKDR